MKNNHPHRGVVVSAPLGVVLPWELLFCGNYYFQKESTNLYATPKGRWKLVHPTTKGWGLLISTPLTPLRAQ